MSTKSKVISYTVEKVKASKSNWFGIEDEYLTILECEDGTKYKRNDPWCYENIAVAVGDMFIGATKEDLGDPDHFTMVCR